MTKCILILSFSQLFHISVKGEVFNGIQSYHIDNDSLYSSGCLYYEGENYEKAYECLSSFFADDSWRSSSTLVAKGLRYLSSCYRFGRGCNVDSEKADFWMEQAMQWGDEKALELLFDQDWNTLSDEERRKKLNFCVEKVDIWKTEIEYPILQYRRQEAPSDSHLYNWITKLKIDRVVKNAEVISNGKEKIGFEKRLVDILLSFDALNSHEMYLLAWCYKVGLGNTQIDEKKSQYYLRKAADLGNRDAMYQLALGNFKIEVDEENDSTFIHYALNVPNYEGMQLLTGYYYFKYGRHYYELKYDPDEWYTYALKCWKPLAENGNDIAINNYGTLLYMNRKRGNDDYRFYFEDLVKKQGADRAYNHAYSLLGHYLVDGFINSSMNVFTYLGEQKNKYRLEAIECFEKIDTLNYLEMAAMAGCCVEVGLYEKTDSIRKLISLNGMYGRDPALWRYVDGVIASYNLRFEDAYEDVLYAWSRYAFNVSICKLFKWYSWGKLGHEYDGVFNEMEELNEAKKEYESFRKNLYDKKTKEYIIKGLEILYK